MAQSPLIVNVTHPRRDFTGITQVGLKAFALASAKKAELEARLPAGTLAGLEEDLGALDVAVPGAISARAGAKSATVAQTAALERAHARVQAVRTAVRNAHAPKEVQHAYGVGSALTARSLPRIIAAVTKILDRTAAKPGEAAGLGILQADIDALQATKDEVAQANTTQEKLRASAPLGTKERNRIANRILRATKRIKGAAAIAFAGSPTELAPFNELTLGPRKSSGKAKAPPASNGGAAKPGEPARPAPLA